MMDFIALGMLIILYRLCGLCVFESIDACRGKGQICVGMISSVWHGNFLT